MRSLFYVLFICHTLAFTVSEAQNFPVYNSYYINPYLYNPAEAASPHTTVFVNHRQQWMNIEGAPVLTTVTFNTTLDNTRSAFGVKMSSYRGRQLPDGVYYYIIRCDGEENHPRSGSITVLR